MEDNAVIESTTSQQTASEEAVTEATAAESAPSSEAAENGSQSETSGNESEPEWNLPIRYNHEDINLSRDDAVRYSQLGLALEKSGIDIADTEDIADIADIAKIDGAADVYRKLDYVSALKGVTPKDLIDSIITADENSYREDLLEKFGDDSDTVNKLIELRRNEQKGKYDAILESRKKEEEKKAAERENNDKRRLADEFDALQTEFPEIKTADDIPEDVMKLARQGKDLTYAYLLYKSREDKKISAEKAAQKKAAEASSGKIDSKPEEDNTKTQELIKAFWGK